MNSYQSSLACATGLKHKPTQRGVIVGLELSRQTDVLKNKRNQKANPVWYSVLVLKERKSGFLQAEAFTIFIFFQPICSFCQVETYTSLNSLSPHLLIQIGAVQSPTSSITSVAISSSYFLRLTIALCNRIFSFIPSCLLFQ